MTQERQTRRLSREELMAGAEWTRQRPMPEGMRPSEPHQVRGRGLRAVRVGSGLVEDFLALVLLILAVLCFGCGGDLPTASRPVPIDDYIRAKASWTPTPTPSMPQQP